MRWSPPSPRGNAAQGPVRRRPATAPRPAHLAGHVSVAPYGGRRTGPHGFPRVLRAARCPRRPRVTRCGGRQHPCKGNAAQGPVRRRPTMAPGPAALAGRGSVAATRAAGDDPGESPAQATATCVGGHGHRSTGGTRRSPRLPRGHRGVHAWCVGLGGETAVKSGQALVRTWRAWGHVSVAAYGDRPLEAFPPEAGAAGEGRPRQGGGGGLGGLDYQARRSARDWGSVGWRWWVTRPARRAAARGTRRAPTTRAEGTAIGMGGSSTPSAKRPRPL